MRKKKRQGVIWGKEPKYFTPNVLYHLGQIVSSLGINLFVAGTPDLSCVLPDGVQNLGILSDEHRRQLFLDSIFFLGLGDPVLGVSPFEAMSYGCVYLNPVFPKGSKALWQNVDFSCTSQHPYAAIIGPPLSRSVLFNRPTGVYEPSSMAVVDVVRSVVDDWIHRWEPEETEATGNYVNEKGKARAQIHHFLLFR